MYDENKDGRKIGKNTTLLFANNSRITAKNAVAVLQNPLQIARPAEYAAWQAVPGVNLRNDRKKRIAAFVRNYSAICLYVFIQIKKKEYLWRAKNMLPE